MVVHTSGGVPGSPRDSREQVNKPCRSRCFRVALLGAVAVAALSSRAAAQPAADKTKTETAKQYVNAGLAAQDSGDYDTALTLYTKAHQLVPHPVLLFNMAQAHRLAGRVDQALDMYRRYLTADPSGPQAQPARELIAEIEARKLAEARKLEEARRAEEARRSEEARRLDDARRDAARKVEQDRLAAASRAADQARPAGEARSAEPTRSAQAATAVASEPVSDAASPGNARPGRTLRLGGLASAGAGVVGLAVGVGFGMRAKSLSDELSEPGAEFDPRKVRQGERAETIQITGFVAGSVLVAAGAVMYWWGYREARTGDGVALLPVITDQLTGLALSGSL